MSTRTVGRSLPRALGTDADGDRLVVTAGHCAEGVGDEVTAADGFEIWFDEPDRR